MLQQRDVSIYIGFSNIGIDKHIVCNIAQLMSLFWQKASNLLVTNEIFVLKIRKRTWKMLFV